MSTYTRSMFADSVAAIEAERKRLAARGAREFDIAVQLLGDAIDALDLACKHNEEICNRVNAVPFADRLDKNLLRALRKIALDVVEAP